MLALVLEPMSATPVADSHLTARISRDTASPSRAKGEAIVRMRVAGVCDTDLQLARGYMGFVGVPGHEMVGEVVEAESASWIGKRVVADINAGCGECDDCTTGPAWRRGHHCAARSVLGIVGRAGAFAEKLAIPERCLIEVPSELDDDRAVFAEPLAAALHVVDEIDTASPRAVVLGDGKLGILIALALMSAGVATTLVGHHARKLAVARARGAEALLESDLPKTLVGADLVVEATGSEAGLARALTIVRPRGTVVLKTTIAGKPPIDLAPVVIHELRVVGSRCGDMKRAVEALARGAVDPTPLIEARYPLERADEALVHAARRGTLKVLVDSV